MVLRFHGCGLRGVKRVALKIKVGLRIFLVKPF